MARQDTRKEPIRSTSTAPDRRQMLGLLAGGIGALAAGSGVSVSCAPAPETEVLRVPLDSIAVGDRLRVLRGEDPIEIRRLDDGSVAGRLLWCTHVGCKVSWQEEQGTYLCPCHDGTYDADGKPIGGPPVRALAEVPLEIRDGEILIGPYPEEGRS